MKVRLNARAAADLADIGAWIARDDPDAAERFVAALVAKALEIGEMPLAFPTTGHRYKGEVRKRSYRRYAIFYYVTRSTVVVIRIVHARRDYSRLFGIS